MMRILYVFVITFLAFTGPAFLYPIAALIFAFRYTGYELLVLSLCIDVYFFMGGVPYYLITTIVVLVIIELMKPQLTLIRK